MKKVFLYTLLISIIATGCSDFLDKDKTVDTNLTYKEIFTDPHGAPGFLNNIYNDLNPLIGFNRISGNTFMGCATDEAVHSDLSSSIYLFSTSSISPTLNPDDVWEDMYRGIRKCNIFLKEVDGLIKESNSIKNVTPTFERDNYRGQAYFLRAFFHFELLKRYQNIFYVNNVLDPYNEDDIFSIPQLTFHEAVEKIAQDCDSAAKYIPLGLPKDEEKGRPTRTAPLALKARLHLYAASPLNNPSNDIELWKKAEQATKDAIDLQEGYSSKGGDYGKIFTSTNNSEIIFGSKAEDRNDLERNNFPITFQGKGYTNPSEDLAKSYVMAGTTYLNPWNKYDEEDPYKGRDKRFYATIIYNNMVFFNQDSILVETFVGGKDGLYATSTATKTGYYLRKFLDINLDLPKDKKARRHWIFIRNAELLLNYAEARNEVLDKPDKIVFNQLDIIRQRAGLRPFATSEYNKVTKEEMRNYIKHERRLELAFEDHRMWDLRRWKGDEIEAMTVLNKPVMGMKITYDSVNERYNYNEFDSQNRIFDSKFYWYPIPRREILKYKAKGITVQQNPGWE